jgi:phage-related holin
MSKVEYSAKATRPASAPRKSPPWGERLARVQQRARKTQIGKAGAKSAKQDWVWLTVGQVPGSGIVFPEPVLVSESYRTWMNYYQARWKTVQVKLPPSQAGIIHFHGAIAGSYGFSRLLFDPEDETDSELQTISLPEPDEPRGDRNDREFNVNSSIWLAVSETAKSVRDQELSGWIVGGAIAVLAWMLGGFDLLIKSAMGLAATNSIALILTDIKRGEFGATRTFSELVQFLAFLGLIAIGRFVDYGTHEPMVIVRSFMAYIVIGVCFWRSFRGLACLAGLEGFDELVQAEIDTFTE